MPIRLTLYYRNGCHLCEQMLAELHAMHEGILQIELVDVDLNTDLRERYAAKVPVLADDKDIICQGGMDHTKLELYLNRFGT